MRVPYRWLKEMVDFDWDVDELAERLTMAGLEVAEIDRAIHLDHVVVALVTDVSPHPQNPHLKIVTVRGLSDQQVVVSGAPNVATGKKVAYARPGAVLPDGRAIGVAAFGGVASAGMLCSAAELGLAGRLDPATVAPGNLPDPAAGILMLPDDAPLDRPVMEVLGFDDDVLDLELTVSYAQHCRSILGVAWEVAALTGAGRNWPVGEAVVADALLDSMPGAVTVSIEDPQDCARYSGVVLEDVQVGPAPWWMVARLRACGMRPINNFVDVTNYVMLELGQPLHAFDLDRVRGGQIRVRRAKPGERLVTLDGSERVLMPEDLVIADAEGPVGLAGVMGGEASEITAATRRVFVESAYFRRELIRATSRRLGLRSEASSRFEKGIDPGGTWRAAMRAGSLMSTWGRLLRGGIDVLPRPEIIRPREVVVSASRMNARLGTALEPQEMGDLWRRHGFGVEADGDTLRVTVPTRRPDVVGEADLAEEVARLFGYDRLPATLPGGQPTRGKLPAEEWVARRLRDDLVSVGLSEAVTYAFLSPRDLDRLRLGNNHPWRQAVAIKNPMTVDQSFLRTSVLPSLLAVIGHNQRYRQNDLQLFEIGRVYRSREGGHDMMLGPAGVVNMTAEELLTRGVAVEETMLAIAGTGLYTPRNWHGDKRAVDFFWLKGMIEHIAQVLALPALHWEPAREPFLHPGRAAQVASEGLVLGYAGEIHPLVAEAYGIGGRVMAAELGLAVLTSLAGAARFYQPLQPFAPVQRDLAVILPVNVPADAVEEVARAAGGPYVRGFYVFDVYAGKGIAPGQRSLAFTVTWAADGRPLSDDEINSYSRAIFAALAEKFGATPRVQPQG